MQNIIRANMRTGNVSTLVLPEQYRDVSGRALTAKIISEEVSPYSHPLGKNNKCIIATGLFAGTPFPCSNRCSIGAKSPLTGGIKESNVGGTVTFKLSKLNIRSVVIEDQPTEEHGLYILKLDVTGGCLIPADEYRGYKTYQLASELRQRFGKKIGILMIGPAGELQLSAAGIAATDLRGNPCDYAGRGGMGAVLGSKHVKAIIIDDQGVKRASEYFDREKFISISRAFTKKLKETKIDLHEYGTPIEIDDLDAIAKMDRLCDEIGVDTMEMGAAIGVAMEAGLLAFGDAQGAIALLKEIPKNTSMGRIIGNGAEITGKAFGVRRVPTVKGQGMAAYDPRANKGIGVTYMSSPMGADHTAGCVMPGRTGFDPSKTYDPLKPDGQPEVSLDLQIMVAIIDAMGVCFFVGLEIETINIEI